ncbi:MAG TPA: hypothetical protein VFZ65_20110 [Planctomycetota bacterium]|nr:hypothetical protein [Planctomycetota bacterium]
MSPGNGAPGDPPEPHAAPDRYRSCTGLAPGLVYFVERLQPQHAVQVVLGDDRESKLPEIGRTRMRVVSARRLLANLP